MDLSIVIVSYNTKNLTDDCLASIYRSLERAKFTYEVIVVDNHSTDGTIEMIEKTYKNVRFVKNDINAGFSQANNQGIKIAQGSTILLLNSDTIVLPQAIEKLYQYSVKHKNCFVGPKLLNIDRSAQTSCGPFMNLYVVFAMLFLKGDSLKLTRWSPSEPRFVDWVSGACVIAPRNIFLDGLLFDEQIFMYMEEIDLLFRAMKKGYRTYFYPAAKIIHLGSGSSTDKRKGPIINIYKGLLYFYSKHYSAGSLGILKILLKAKAITAIAVGILTGNRSLRQTYEEAYKMV